MTGGSVIVTLIIIPFIFFYLAHIYSGGKGLSLIIKLSVLNLVLILIFGYSILDDGVSSTMGFSKSSSDFWYHLFNLRLLVALDLFFSELFSQFIIYIILWIGIGYYFIRSYNKNNKNNIDPSSYLIGGIVLLFLIITIFFGLVDRVMDSQRKQMQQYKQNKQFEELKADTNRILTPLNKTKELEAENNLKSTTSMAETIDKVSKSTTDLDNKDTQGILNQSENNQNSNTSDKIWIQNNLMWTKESYDVNSWDEALRLSNNFKLLGYSDWRLPSDREIINTYKCINYNCIPITQYMEYKHKGYWTGTDRSISYYGSTGKKFFNSVLGSFPKMSLDTSGGVRLVRDIKN